jgi:hypothetical protein
MSCKQMNALYTLVITCDGGDEIAQELAATPAAALDQWTKRLSPCGIVDTLSAEEVDELRSDFSASDPTIFGIDKSIDGMKGVWRASTALASGKHIVVVCVQGSAKSVMIAKTEQIEQSGTGQTATCSEPNSEDCHKPQPEAEGRSGSGLPGLDAL